MAKILVIDDDRELCDLVEKYLTQDGHLVEKANSGSDGSTLLTESGYDLVVMDLGLPGIDGLTLCTQFRARGNKTPVIMLTGRDAIIDRERGLDSGADDYLTKPFSMRELSARVRAVLRRPEQLLSNVITVGSIALDTTQHFVTKDGNPVKLLPNDFRLLEFLMRHPNDIFSTEVLLKRVWHTDAEATGDSVRSSIKRIRRALDDGGDDVAGSIIETVPKIGYRLKRPS